VPVLPLSPIRRDHHGRQPGPAGGSVRSDQHGQLLDQQHIPATLDGYQQLGAATFLSTWSMTPADQYKTRR
jgi:hypothetical protein